MEASCPKAIVRRLTMLLDLSRRVAGDEHRPREGIEHRLLQHRILQRQRLWAFAVLQGAAAAYGDRNGPVLLRRLGNERQRLSAVAGHHPAETAKCLHELDVLLSGIRGGKSVECLDRG